MASDRTTADYSHDGDVPLCQESWEIGSRYVRQTVLFDANNDIAAWRISDFKSRPQMSCSQNYGHLLVMGYIMAPKYSGVPEWDPNLGNDSNHGAGAFHVSQVQAEAAESEAL